jgi:NAD-dependent SIR2 family protein deacetylase
MATDSSLAVLLGAGASVDAGIPASLGMTQKVIESMAYPDHRRLLEFVRSMLAANRALDRPTAPVWNTPPSLSVEIDVERLFAAIEVLVARNTQPWSPFVASWHPGLESFARPPSLRPFDMSSEAQKVAKEIRDLIPSDTRRSVPGQGTSRLERALVAFVGSATERARPGDVADLLRIVRSAMLNSLIAISNIEKPEDTTYFYALIQLGHSRRSLTIATLNYDRSIETAAQLLGLECHTGIETWLARGELAWPESGLQLLKLHGSIDWVAQPWSGMHGLPTNQIRLARPDERSYEPAIVFGEGGKLRSEGPYLALLLAWATELNRADSLLVVGYSFRDEHVNEVIARWFNADSRRRIVLLDPTDPGTAPADSFAEEVSRLAAVDAAASEPARFTYIQGTAKTSLAQAIQAASVAVPT